MLQPKKTKYRKVQKARRNEKKQRVEHRSNFIAFGSHGLKAMTRGAIRSEQIEAARRVIVRTAGKTGKLWIRIFPATPFTQKGAGVKMGKGKGGVEGYEVRVLPGRLLFEIDNVESTLARKALKKAAAKLPVKAKVIDRE